MFAFLLDLIGGDLLVQEAGQLPATLGFFEQSSSELPGNSDVARRSLRAIFP
jgi:hypothetical protein